MWQGKVGGNFPLESSGTIRWGEGKNEGKKKRKKRKERRKKRGVRSSTFSLGFIDIEQSIFIEARGNVHLCDKSFAWV